MDCLGPILRHTAIYSNCIVLVDRTLPLLTLTAKMFVRPI